MTILRLEYNCRHIEGTRFAVMGSEPTDEQLAAFFSPARLGQKPLPADFIRAAREAIKTGRDQHWQPEKQPWGDIFVTPVNVIGLE